MYGTRISPQMADARGHVWFAWTWCPKLQHMPEFDPIPRGQICPFMNLTPDKTPYQTGLVSGLRSLHGLPPRFDGFMS